MLVPTLFTPRLVLRAHEAADLSDCTRLWADPVVTRFIGGKPSTPEETWGRILRYAGHWSLLGFGYWLVRERATQALVGEVGLADFRRTMTPPLPGPEMGWVITPDMHGKGYATEAVRAALTFSDGNLEASRTTCIIDAENLASIRVAEKTGYAEVGVQDYRGARVTVYARPRK